MEFYKYTISKKGFFRKSFEIFEGANLLYRVNNIGFFAYRKLVFTDINDTEILVIERPFNFGSFKFLFKENGNIKGEFTKAMMSKTYTLQSEYATYVTEGNWLGNEYTVYLGDEDIAKISRKILTSKNQYGVAIIEGNHNLYILAMVIIIEVIKIIKRKRGS